MTQAATQRPEGVDELAGRLRQLRLARHPMGLRAGAARRFAEDVRSDGDVSKAIRNAGGDLRLASIVELAQPSDAVRLVGELLPVLGEVAVHRRSLQSAAFYPFALSACLAMVSVAIYGIATPAIAALAEVNGMSAVATRLGGSAGVFTCMAMLLLLAAAVYSRVQVPLLSHGGVMLERALVLETVVRLHDQGTPLALAFRAAASWVRGADRQSIHAAAERLESGGTSAGTGRLLDAATMGLLISAAGRGVVSPVLSALTRQARLAGQRQIDGEVSRIHIVALLLAAVGLAAAGLTFFGAYVAAATG